MTYFSDREAGPRTRIDQEIGVEAWGGIVSLVESLVATGAFGSDFPEGCLDGRGTTGTDERAFLLALRAELPHLSWPLDERQPPPTLVQLDLVEFCHGHVSHQHAYEFHSFYGHDHLDFNRDEGRAEYRERIERIFSRNGLAYELGEDGRVVRIAQAGLREALASSIFNTGDQQLDTLLEIARTRFLSPDPNVRRDALEKLWDAFERIKSLDTPDDKRASVLSLLSRVSPESNFRDRLNTEARELTSIGNSFRIRHSETSQTPPTSEAHVDYLFHRLFSFVQLCLR